MKLSLVSVIFALATSIGTSLTLSAQTLSSERDRFEGVVSAEWMAPTLIIEIEYNKGPYSLNEAKVILQNWKNQWRTAHTNLNDQQMRANVNAWMRDQVLEARKLPGLQVMEDLKSVDDLIKDHNRQSKHSKSLLDAVINNIGTIVQLSEERFAFKVQQKQWEQAHRTLMRWQESIPIYEMLISLRERSPIFESSTTNISRCVRSTQSH